MGRAEDGRDEDGLLAAEDGRVTAEEGLSGAAEEGLLTTADCTRLPIVPWAEGIVRGLRKGALARAPTPPIRWVPGRGGAAVEGRGGREPLAVAVTVAWCVESRRRRLKELSRLASPIMGPSEDADRPLLLPSPGW